MDKLDVLESINTTTSHTHFYVSWERTLNTAWIIATPYCAWPSCTSSHRYRSALLVEIQINKTSLNVYAPDLIPDYSHFQTEICTGKTQQLLFTASPAQLKTGKAENKQQRILWFFVCLKMSTAQNVLASFDNERVYLAYMKSASKRGTVSSSREAIAFSWSLSLFSLEICDPLKFLAFSGPEAEGPCVMLELESEPVFLHQRTL